MLSAAVFGECDTPSTDLSSASVLFDRALARECFLYLVVSGGKKVVYEIKNAYNFIEAWPSEDRESRWEVVLRYQQSPKS